MLYVCTYVLCTMRIAVYVSMYVRKHNILTNLDPFLLFQLSEELLEVAITVFQNLFRSLQDNQFYHMRMSSQICTVLYKNDAYCTASMYVCEVCLQNSRILQDLHIYS